MERLSHCGACRSVDVQTGLHDIACFDCGAITHIDGSVRRPGEGVTTTEDLNV
jgi:hypothetical protein